MSLKRPISITMLVLPIAWSILCPWLTGIARDRALAIAPLSLVLALLPGLAALRGAAWASAQGTQGALRLGAVFTAVSLVGVLLGTAVASLELGLPQAIALGLCSLGAAILCALSLTAAASSRFRHTRGRGAQVRVLVAGACGSLALAAWTLASGHMLGQRHAYAERRALAEARDLAVLVSSRALVLDEIGNLPGGFMVPGGFVAYVDEGFRVIDSVGQELPRDTLIGVLGGTRPHCRIEGRDMPCGVRKLADGSRVIAAVPTPPVDGGGALVFAMSGFLVALGALGLGMFAGADTARDLEQVATLLDELGRSARGLERSIVAVSVDEIGDLAVSLAHLRAHLAPQLREHADAVDKAQAADRARTDFLTLVQSELRAPLEQIIASARTILDPASEPLTDEQREDVRIVLQSSTQLIELIDEVLDLSAIATGKVALRLALTEIGRLVEDVAKAQRPLVQAKGIEIKFTTDDPSPLITGDERRLRQVITNIVSNAVKFTEKGSIELAVHKRGENVDISVRDTGPGIASEQISKLFSEFVQLGSLKQRARGTGLGLAICRRLVEAHGGKITVESRLGEGSVFRVVLPEKGPSEDQFLAPEEAP